VKAQIEGRSLVPLLENPAADWPDREIFTHVGRWPKDADPQKYKFTNCSVRTARWQLVNANTARGGAPRANARRAGEAANKTAGTASSPAEAIVRAGPEPMTSAWQLFDLSADPGQQTDVAAAHPEVVKKLAAAYDAWWDGVQPMLVNEKVPLAPENPFKTLYLKQFGALPAAQ
jgi:hypothetical protein